MDTKDNLLSMLSKSLKLTIITAITSSYLIADISGVVYKDFDLNGKMDGGDTGVSGVVVTAVCDDGNSTSTTTNEDGNYTLSGFSQGAICRVEADPSNAGLGSGPNAQGSAPLVDMVADGTTHDISTGSPATYCQANPDVIMAAIPAYYNKSDDDACDNKGDRAGPKGFGTVFKVQAPEDGDFNDNDTIKDKRKTIVKQEDTGAIWGAAWKKSTKELFVSAVIRRYAPLHDESSTDKAKESAGAIYKIVWDDNGNSNIEEFVSIPDTITDDDAQIIVDRNYDKGKDQDIKELVGFKGLGDLDISEDDKYLYTINLNKKQLVKIDTSNGDIVSSVDMPNPYSTDDCNDSSARPWGLKVRGDEIYIGYVCEDQILYGDDPTDMDASGLGAAIQKYDVSSDSFNTVAITNTLRFLRPRGYNPKKETNYQYQNTDWSHGSYEWLPQPMLTDIEFTNKGDLVLGYTDRSIMIREREGSHGDIRKMCLNEDGTFTDESTERVKTDCNSTAVKYKDNDEIYYEFYTGDYFNGYLGEDGHPETASGALAMAPGAPSIIVGMVDGTDWWQPGSIGLYDNDTGDKSGAQAVINKDRVDDGGEREPYACKAGGMGDVELLCDPAPIEIGNYLWIDLNEDGIQDPNEPAISDVNVTLYCGDEKYGEATTDKDGHYYFGGKDNVNLDDGKELKANLTCELRVAKADVDNKDATKKDVNEDKNDTIDNDASSDDNDYNIIDFNTTVFNNHTLDFGIKPAYGCVSGQLKQNEGNTRDAADKVTVTLVDAYGNKYTTETNEDGNYTFEHILAGDAVVEVDTADTDLNERTVWEDNTTADVDIEESDECKQQDFTYDIENDLVKIDPANIATCAKPSSLLWEGSDVNDKDTVTWKSLANDVIENVSTQGGDEVVIKSMKLTYNDDDELNDDKSGTESGGGYNGKPFLSFYLGDQEDPGDGKNADTYDLKAGEKIEVTIEFEEPVILDNWRVRDVDSGDDRNGTKNWDWQDAVKMVGYDEDGNEVNITANIASDTTSIVDEDGFVRTDIGTTDNCNLVPSNYNDGDTPNPNYHSAGENSNCAGDDNNGTGYTADDPEGQVVFTSNFKPLTKIVITHKAGPDLPNQTRSALAMFGFAVCKPLHIAGTVYDDKDGTKQADCSNDDTINGDPISQVDDKNISACLLDEDGIVLDTQELEDGTYDFDTGIHPNTTYGMLITTSKCTVGDQAPSGDLAEGWNYEGETYTNSPDGKLDGYVDVDVEEDSVRGLDFAINKTPVAKGYLRKEELNPEDDNQVDFVNNGQETSDFINDAEQGTDVIMHILKINNGKLYYDGNLVSNDDNITDPDISKFKIDPDDGDVEATFTYELIDDACRVSDDVLFKAPFTTVYISGNLFLDSTRNDTVDGDKTNTSCDGSTKLYANLVDDDNKVVSAKEIDDDGHYAFFYADGLESNTDYYILLSKTKGEKGDDAPSTELTARCIHADGEHIGTDEGTDGNPDGNISVSVGEENIEEINFAITPTVNIGDRVWIEDDNDGNASTGAVKAAKDINVSISCENGYEDNTTTNDDGIYSFTLPINIGDCTVKVDTPQDTVPSKGSDDNSVDDTTSENDLTHDGNGTTVTVGDVDNLTVDFGFTDVGNISGNVSKDTTKDGNGDENFEGVEIKLYKDSDGDGKADGDVIETTQTDEDGNYIFENLTPGDYVVVEVQPDGYFDVKEKEGGDDGDDLGNDANNNQISAVVDAGETDSGNDFVEIQEASLGDTVWYDNDANGEQSDKESDGVANVTVTLQDSNGNTLSSVTTDSNGKYKFEHLNPMIDYVVAFDKDTLPQDYVITAANEGNDDSLDSDANTDSGKTDAISLQPGSYDDTIDMGIHINGATKEKPYMIGTHFWIDVNGNSKYDASDEPLANALIELYDEDGHKLYWSDDTKTTLTTNKTDWPAEVYTDSKGTYHFFVPAGTYQVHFNMPEKYQHEYVFSNKQTTDDDNVNKANSNGYSQLVTVGPDNETIDLKLDASITCGCSKASVKSNGGDALGMVSILMMMLISIFSGISFIQRYKIEEEV